ncbi:MAG TPA: hypothetical protein VNT30_12480 [Stellaceae bacterium]|nr:hypothetical protein [Stellaceae bacterium]
MSVFILTEQNCLVLRRLVKTEAPHVKSAHIAEALAASMGFGTHAALLAAIRAEPHLPPGLANCDLSRFADRLSVLIGSAAPNFDLEALTRSPSIPDLPFAVFAAADRGANNHHFYCCRGLNRPMMYIHPARKYVKLWWDCITIHTDFEDFLFAGAGGELVERLFAMFQMRAKGAPGKPIFQGSAFAGSVEKLLPETARLLADDFFKALYLPLREPRGPRPGNTRSIKPGGPRPAEWLPQTATVVSSSSQRH